MNESPLANKPVMVFGNHDQATFTQLHNCLNAHDSAKMGVLCADGHKGYAQPVGGVIAYDSNHISISGVGFDIACGNLAIKTDATLADIGPEINYIMDQIVERISFGVGRSNKTEVDHELFYDDAWKGSGVAPLRVLAREQLGTVGSGNHYVDIFADEQDMIWIGVHFGSRGLGHKTATYFLKEAGGTDGMDVPPTVVDIRTTLGQDYLNAMELCGRYAYAGREWVANEVRKILGADTLDTVHNHHNYAWAEMHHGQPYWVVRKGATPAFPGQRGFVGGSMGDDAVIIEGVDSESSKSALYSTVHGAGRVMSRTQAKGKVHRKTGVQISEGAVKRSEMDEWIKNKGVCLRGADLDESPQAYRRLSEVLEHHQTTIKILHTLRPIGVAMAGNGTIDPYKD